MSPYERWYDRRPDLKHFEVFGCVAHAHIPDSQRNKLNNKAQKLRFVGYSTSSKGYRLLNEKTTKVIISRDVIFNESDFNIKEVMVESGISSQLDIEEEAPQKLDHIDNDVAQIDEPVIETRRHSTRQRQAPVRYGIDEYVEAAINNTEATEPNNIKEALANDEWKAAADAEFRSLTENNTWDLVVLPEGRKPVECKWIFKIKRGSDGSIKHYKARLVAKGFSQKHGTDYDETFAPVVMYTSIRTLIAYAVQNNMLMDQMDVVRAFLNGTLEEDIYMTQPEGYVRPGEENEVCKLKRSLYGLKQSPRCWNITFKEHMKSMRFDPSAADPCIFVRKEKSGEMSMIAVYVDDLIIVAKTDKMMTEIKRCLEARFKMKDLGRLHHCLGITVEYDNSGSCLWLHQKLYLFYVG